MKKLREIFSPDKKVFIPFLMAGDPGVEETVELLLECEKRGVDAIELGVPYSDPLADGEVNQAAAQRALKRGVSLVQVFEIARQARDQGLAIPLILFSYFNPLLKFGLERMAYLAKEVGINAVLVVDLPLEEAGALQEVLLAHQLESIFLATPTTPKERFKKLARASTGFLYYVSRNGVTGQQQEMTNSLSAELEVVKREVDTPVAVGFGISKASSAKVVGELADGVVVGSALVDLLSQRNGRQSFLKLLSELTQAVHSIGIK